MIASPMSSEPVDPGAPLRVLRVLTRPNLGGPTRQAIALWHSHRAQGVETLLVAGAVGEGEVKLSPDDHGVPRATGERPAAGWLELPELARGVDPLRDVRAQRRLRRLVRAFRPHVVHTHTSKAGAVGRRAAFAEATPVVAHTFHGHVLNDYFGALPSMLLRRLERRLAQRTDVLFAVSDSCADELAARGVAPRERFCVLPPAVAPARALTRGVARSKLGLGETAWVAAAVGRLVPIKRLDHFVEVVAREPALCGDVLGDGPLRAALAAHGAGACGGRLRVLGARPDAASLLTAYDAVVLPSVREGCPLVAVEAFAAGVPVVGYDVPGVRDALGALGRGLLVPVADGPGGLLAAVRRLRDEPGLRAELIEAAGVAVPRCCPDAVGAALATAYRDAMRAGPPRARIGGVEP